MFVFINIIFQKKSTIETIADFSIIGHNNAFVCLLYHIFIRGTSFIRQKILCFCYKQNSHPKSFFIAFLIKKL